MPEGFPNSDARKKQLLSARQKCVQRNCKLYHNSSILYKKGYRICHLLEVIGVCTAPSRMILGFLILGFLVLF